MEDGRVALTRGETLLSASADRLSLALLLCQRAEAERLAGEAANATSALARATRLGVELAVEPVSELGTRLRALHALFAVGEEAAASLR